MAPSDSPALLILDRDEAARYRPAGREICISIRGADIPELDLSPVFLAVLPLLFDDIDTPGADPADVLFAPGHARQIVDFVESWRDLDRIVVHCEMGVSRSPAVALGLCDLFGWPAADLERDYPLWNRWVRGELVRTGRPMLDLDPESP